MSEARLEINLGPDIAPVIPESWKAAEKWLGEEDAPWNWLFTEYHNPASVGESFRSV